MLTITPQVAARVAQLGRTLDSPRVPRDPADVVELLELQLAHGLAQGDLCAISGLSRKLVRSWSQGRLSGGRPWPALARALAAAGIELRPRCPDRTPRSVRRLALTRAAQTLARERWALDVRA